MISYAGNEIWNLFPLLVCGVFGLTLIIRKILNCRNSNEEMDHKDELSLPGTPVRSCIGIFDLLLDGKVPPKPRYVRRCKHRGKHETPQESDDETTKNYLEKVD